MVEEPYVLLDKSDPQLLRRLEDGRVVLAAAGCGYVLGSRAFCAEDVVRKGELEKQSVSAYGLK